MRQPVQGRIGAEWVSPPAEGRTRPVVLHTRGREDQPAPFDDLAGARGTRGGLCEYFLRRQRDPLLLPSLFRFPICSPSSRDATILALLRKRLEATGIFGARFRGTRGGPPPPPEELYPPYALLAVQAEGEASFQAFSVFPDFPITPKPGDLPRGRIRSCPPRRASRRLRRTIELTETITSSRAHGQRDRLPKVNDLIYRGDDQKAVFIDTDEIIADRGSNTKRLAIRRMCRRIRGEEEADGSRYVPRTNGSPGTAVREDRHDRGRMGGCDRGLRFP
jgi:hypothetical protein